MFPPTYRNGNYRDMSVGTGPLIPAMLPQFQAPLIGGNVYGTFSNEQHVQSHDSQASAPFAQSSWRSLPAPWNSLTTRISNGDSPSLAQSRSWNNSNQPFIQPLFQNLHVVNLEYPLQGHGGLHDGRYTHQSGAIAPIAAQALPNDGNQLANSTDSVFNSPDNTHARKRKRRESLYPPSV